MNLSDCIESLLPPMSNNAHNTTLASIVARRLGLEVDAMATIEVTKGSRRLYKSILQYVACHGVPLGVSFSTADNDEKHCALKSLWNAPENCFDYDSDVDSDDEKSSSEGFFEGDTQDSVVELTAELIGLGFSQIDDVFGSRCGLRKKSKGPVLEWQAGLGYAKVRCGEDAVYIHHYTLGEPVDTEFGIQVFRGLTLTSNNIAVLQKLCVVALKWRLRKDQELEKPKRGKFVMHRFKLDPHGNGNWECQGRKIARPVNTVILQKGQLYSIIKDVHDFMSKSTKEWYHMHGLPHRRSLLFHGVPGSGKTSSIRVLAGLFKLNACFLSLTGNNFNNQTLQDAMASIPDRALLVVEDCDALFNENRKTAGYSALTFSAFLNCLDGLSSTDGIITVLTTNHMEKLDPALVRAGRVDRRFEFVRPDQEQIANLFASFYTEAPRELAVKFAKLVLERSESEARCIATLQQHFIYTRTRSAEECVKALPEFFSEFYPKGADQRYAFYT